MRRLDLQPLKRLRNPGRHLRALDRWAAGFEGFFPDAGALGLDQPMLYWKVPIPSKLVADKHTTPEIRRRVILALIDAARRLDAARPETCTLPVVAFIGYPDLFASEVALFLDPGALIGYLPAPAPSRAAYGDFWCETGPPHHTPLADLAIPLPPGFRAAGYHEKSLSDPDTGQIHETDRWVVGRW
jgi:hypothetical protein